MAKRITPRRHHTLAEFLRLVMENRDRLTVERLATLLTQRVPKADDSWERQIKAWRSDDGPQALQRANAELLSDVLDADFSPFVRQYVTSQTRPDEEAIRQMIREEVSALLEQIEQLRRRLDDQALPESGAGGS